MRNQEIISVIAVGSLPSREKIVSGKVIKTVTQCQVAQVVRVEKQFKKPFVDLKMIRSRKTNATATESSMEEKEENPGVKGTITKHFIAKSSDKKLHNLSILDGAGARCSLM